MKRIKNFLIATPTPFLISFGVFFVGWIVFVNIFCIGVEIGNFIIDPIINMFCCHGFFGLTLTAFTAIDEWWGKWGHKVCKRKGLE